MFRSAAILLFHPHNFCVPCPPLSLSLSVDRNVPKSQITATATAHRSFKPRRSPRGQLSEASTFTVRWATSPDILSVQLICVRCAYTIPCLLSNERRSLTLTILLTSRSGDIDAPIFKLCRVGGQFAPDFVFGRVTSDRCRMFMKKPKDYARRIQSQLYFHGILQRWKKATFHETTCS